MPQPVAGLSRGSKLFLVFVATPFFGACSFVAIAMICGAIGYRLFGANGLGIIPWSITQFLACAVLTLALALVEGTRVGSLWIYTILGIGTGVAFFLLMSLSGLGKGAWIIPMQYGLIGHLIGRIAYRGVNRPAPVSEAKPDGAQVSEKEI